MWPTVRRQFADPAQRLLFDAQGQPKREFKDSLEGASRKLGLRHLFGVAGTHNYYISVYLQFGFTRKGMERLPHWLAGLPTSEAVSQQLSSADDRGSDRRGESFLSLWDTLRGFRRNNITEANARTRLSRSPWVLPNWVDDLIEQASKSRDIPDREFGLDSVEPIPPVFLADAKLRWDPPANPEFTTAIINLADFDLTSDRYRVMVGDERLATLLRTDGGDYDTRPERVTLPSHAADLTAVLSDDEGHAPASQLLNLWDPDEDVELFDLATGDRIDPNVVQHAPSKNYGLLVSADLMVEPPGLQYRMIGAGNQTKKLYLLSGGHDGLVRVSVPGTPGGDSGLWSLAINGNSLSRSQEPDWAVGLFTSIVPSRPQWLGRHQGICVTVPDSSVALQYVRVGGLAVDFAPGEQGTYFTEYFDVSRSVSTVGPQKIKIKMGLRRGTEQAAVDRDCLTNSKGVLRDGTAGWEVVDSTGKLSTNDARRCTYKLVTQGTGITISDLALMEGPVFLRRAWSRPQSLGELGGYGATLEIRAPYNPLHNDDSLPIANEVRNPGILVGISSDPGRGICLRFRDVLEPGDDHEIVLWPIGGFPEKYRAIDVVVHQDTEWACRVWTILLSVFA